MPRCVTHCPPEGGGGPSLLAVAGVLAGVAVAAAILEFAESIAEAAALTVFAACGVCVVVLVRLLVPAKFKAQARSLNKAGANSRLRALPAPPKAIERPRQVIPGEVAAEPLDDAHHQSR